MQRSGRIDDIWSSLRKNQQRALMPFACAGYPAPGMLGETLLGIQRGGASIVEVGIPFSDPIADGPVIAAAMHEALTHGATPGAILDEIRDARSILDIGIVLMVSMSIIYAVGSESFIQRAAGAGCDGLIVPDLPLEEASQVATCARDAGLSMPLLIAPGTSEPRAAAIARASTGFVYLMARTGITGERIDAPDIARDVAMLRGRTTLPIACGFGITTAAHVRAVVQHAEAAIVGSAMVRHMGQAPRGTGAQAAEAFTRDLASGLVQRTDHNRHD